MAEIRRKPPILFFLITRDFLLAIEKIFRVGNVGNIQSNFKSSSNRIFNPLAISTKSK